MAESFSRRLRRECLDEQWLLSLTDVRSKIEAWRSFYSERCPRNASAFETPAELAREQRA